MLPFPICTLQVRSYQRRDKRTGTASCSASPKAASAFHLSPWMSLCLTSAATKKKKKSSARVQREVKRERKVVLLFFLFFCSCSLVRFSPPGRRGASLWQPQGCRCGMRRRQFHQALAWNKPSYKSGSSTVTTGELSAGADHRSGKFTSHWNQLLNSAAPFTIVYTYCCNK